MTRHKVVSSHGSDVHILFTEIVYVLCVVYCVLQGTVETVHRFRDSECGLMFYEYIVCFRDETGSQ